MWRHVQTKQLQAREMTRFSVAASVHTGSLTVQIELPLLHCFATCLTVVTFDGC